MRKYFELIKEQDINKNSKARKSLLGGITAYVNGDVTYNNESDSWEYPMKIRKLWSYINYKWIKKFIDKSK